MTFLRKLTARAAVLSALTLTALPALPAAHADEASFTAAQRQEIVSIVRQALKTDPSILGDAITAMRAQSEAVRQAGALKIIRENHSRLAGAETDVVLGNPHGTQTIVEFYDPRCPYCRKVLSDLDRLTAENHDLRLVEKVIPVLGANSQLEARALVAAIRQKGYMKLQHVMMADSETPSEARIRTLATTAGLNADQLIQDMNSPSVRATIEENLELARKIDVDGTPTFIINEKMIVPGAASADDLRNALRATSKND